MNIVMNGQPRACAATATVAALIEELGLTRDRLAVELDGEIVPRSSWAQATLVDGSHVEIVRAIGGG
jgi:sulfur carrier protein